MINSVHLLGHIGQAPQIKRTEKGQRYAILSLATSRRWKDKDTQARHERTEWHRVVVWNERLLELVEKYVMVGAKIWIEGSLASRDWTDKDGIKRYVTEVVLQGPQGRLELLDRKGGGGVADPQGEDDYGHEKEPVYA
jgi:single-strand DNA-binding protein